MSSYWRIGGKDPEDYEFYEPPEIEEESYVDDKGKFYILGEISDEKREFISIGQQYSFSLEDME